MSVFIEEYRERFGVEPICHTLGVSVSAYYERASGRLSDRQVEDERLLAKISELHEANYCAYGYRRTWKALLRAGENVGRDRVRRLMRQAGISGLVKVKKGRTTIRVPGVRVADDLVERKFRPDAPNVLWVADFERHEVLCDRVGVRDLRGLPVAAGGCKLGAA